VDVVVHINVAVPTLPTIAFTSKYFVFYNFGVQHFSCFDPATSLDLTSDFLPRGGYWWRLLPSSMEEVLAKQDSCT
jgi:hypothetical protein